MLQDLNATAAVRAATRRDSRAAGATRVLVAHADADARRAIAQALGADGCEVTEVGDASVVLDTAWRERPHVLLLDAWLGPAGARSLLRRIASDPDLFRIAVVLVGWPAGPEAAIEALDHGAQDILVGDPSAPEVLARVRAARRAHDLQEQLLSREQALERLAYVDELTGLPNRRFLLRQLEAQLSRARRHGHDVAVVMVDADRFKALNDRHGHQAGDLALQAIATRLRERVRREDVVARVGGEEFVVVLPDTDADGAAAAAEDLRAAVAERPVDIGRLSVPLTISAGLAVWEGESLERLLSRADGALYAAKAAGRDRVHAAAPGRVPVSR